MRTRKHRVQTFSDILSSSTGIECLENRVLLTSVYVDDSQIVDANSDAVEGAPTIPIFLDGQELTQGDQIVLSHRLIPAAGADFRSILTLDSTGHIEYRHAEWSKTTETADSFGTSFELPPGIVLNQGGGAVEYFSKRLLSINVDTTQINNAAGGFLRFRMTGQLTDNNGDAIPGIIVDWIMDVPSPRNFGPHIIPPTSWGPVRLTTYFFTPGELDLDTAAADKGGAFRVIQMNSTNVSEAQSGIGERVFDANQLVVTDKARSSLYQELKSKLNLSTAPINTALYTGGLPYTGEIALNQLTPSPAKGDKPNFSVNITNDGETRPHYRVQAFIAEDLSTDLESPNVDIHVGRDFSGNIIPAGTQLSWRLNISVSDFPENAMREDAYRYSQTTGLGGAVRSGGVRANIDPGAGWDMHLGDFNGDGDTDFAGRKHNGEWWVIQNSERNQIVQSQWGRWGHSAITTWSEIQVVNFNGDEFDDILGRDQNGQWWVATSNGSRFETKYAGRLAPDNWEHFVSGDFDGDGRTDLAGLRDDGNWWIAFSNGDRLQLKHGTTWAANSDWAEFHIADLDGDHNDEILVKDLAGYWYSLDWNNLSSNLETKIAGRWSAGLQNTLVGDFNGDGSEELAGMSANGQWWWLESRQDGTFQRTQFIAQWDDSDAVSYAADLDGNGVTDIVSLSDAEQFQPIIYGQGSYFEKRQIYKGVFDETDGDKIIGIGTIRGRN